MRILHYGLRIFLSADYADYTDYKKELAKISHRPVFALVSYAAAGAQKRKEMDDLSFHRELRKDDAKFFYDDKLGNQNCGG